MKKPVLIGVLFVAVVLGVLIYTSLNLATHEVEVCMAFGGQTACRKASGSTRDFALRTAVINACSQISSGVTDSGICERSEPVSTNWLK
jgi:hypothetical protein